MRSGSSTRTKEHIAVAEARKLGIPIVAILDANCDPDVVDYPIPGNDDAIRAVGLLTRVIADAVAEGKMARAGAGDETAGRDAAVGTRPAGAASCGRSRYGSRTCGRSRYGSHPAAEAASLRPKPVLKPHLRPKQHQPRAGQSQLKPPVWTCRGAGRPDRRGPHARAGRAR